MPKKAPPQLHQEAPLAPPQEDPQELDSVSADGSETVQYVASEALLAETLQSGLSGDAEVQGMVAMLRQTLIRKRQNLSSPNPEGPHPSASGSQGASHVYRFEGNICTPPATPRRDAEEKQQGLLAEDPLPEAPA